MQEKLVIVLHAHDLTHPDCALLAADGTVSKLMPACDTSLLAQEAQNRSVLVIVPAEDVLLTTVTLPKMNHARLLQAIPFALEEQINDDLDTLHFAAGVFKANEPLPVMVTARAKMTEWLALLQTWHVTADEMIPSVLALPNSTSSWFVMMNDIAVVRTGEAHGFACDKVNLASMLLLALANASVQPAEIQVETSDTDALTLALPVPVQVTKVDPSQQLEKMFASLPTEISLNLLQGNYQNKKSRRMPKLTQLVKMSVYMIAALLISLFLYPVVSYAILDQRAAAINSQIAQIYKRHFPNATSVIAPKDRMQQKLNKLTADISDNQLLLMMGKIGKGLASASGVQLKRMDFQSNIMTLEITAATSEIFSTFTDALAQQGLRVKQQNANLSGARVSASLQIE